MECVFDALVFDTNIMKSRNHTQLQSCQSVEELNRQTNQIFLHICFHFHFAVFFWFLCEFYNTNNLKHPEIVKPKSEVLSPKVKAKRTWADTKITRLPQTLAPTPQTLAPTPQTLALTPQTLAPPPNSQTLAPTPQTLAPLHYYEGSASTST